MTQKKKIYIYIKWSLLFPTRIHAKFSNKRTYKQSSEGNEWNQLHVNFLAKCEPFLSGVALHTVLNDYSCLCCALLTIALNQWFSTFFVPWPLQQPILAQQPPSKAQIKQMEYSCVHKICTDAPSKNIILQVSRKEHKKDFQTTNEFYLVSFSQTDFRLAANTFIRNLKMICSILPEVWPSQQCVG